MKNPTEESNIRDREEEESKIRGREEEEEESSLDPHETKRSKTIPYKDNSIYDTFDVEKALTQNDEYSDTHNPTDKQEVNINTILHSIPVNAKRDPIEDITYRSILDKMAKKTTTFNRFQNIITAAGKEKDTILDKGLTFINTQFKAKLKKKNINKITNINDLLKTKTPTPYELLRITQAFTYLQILKFNLKFFGKDPEKQAEEDIDTIMGLMNQLKIFLIDHPTLKTTIEKMYTSTNLDNFVTQFDELVGLITKTTDKNNNGVVMAEIRALMQAIFDLREEFRGNSGAPAPGPMDTDTQESDDDDDDAHSIVPDDTMIDFTRLIVAHALFPKNVVHENHLSKQITLTTGSFDKGTYNSLNNNLNIEIIHGLLPGGPSGTLNDDSEEEIKLRIYYTGIAIMLMNGNYNPPPPDDNKYLKERRLHPDFKGGKSRKTRKIKKTKRTNKKNKRNTKKGRKMRQTRKK